MKQNEFYELGITTNLNIFKLIESNRHIAEEESKAIIKLVDSIETTGSLITPVIVDKDMKVIDGQHRIKALNVLNKRRELVDKDPLPCPYFKHKQIDYKLAMIECNNTQRPWKLHDYLHFRKVLEDSEVLKLYEQLEIYCKTYQDEEEDRMFTPKQEFSLTICADYFRRRLTDNAKTQLKKNTYAVNIERGQKLLDMCYALKDNQTIGAKFKQKKYISAIEILWRNSDYTFDVAKLKKALSKYDVQPRQVDLENSTKIAVKLAEYYNKVVKGGDQIHI